MGAFSDFMQSNGLKPEHVVRTSRQIEAWDSDIRTLAQKRSLKRRDQKDKSYADAGLSTKPTAGRGVSMKSIQSAMADQPVPVKVRSKIARAVNVMLTKAKKPTTEPGALFAGVAAKKKAKAEPAKKG